MKASLVLSLLPLLAAATPNVLQRRNLPVVDLDTLEPGEYHGSAVQVGKYVQGAEAKLCPVGYPFVCNGRCCPFNLCCALQCCNLNTKFCGADGQCYVYDTSKPVGFAGSGAPEPTPQSKTM